MRRAWPLPAQASHDYARTIARARRGSVSGAHFFMNDALYLMACLDGDPPLTDEQLAELKQGDESGGPPYNGLAGSWQSEYDLPELAEYSRIKHPQP